MKNKILILLLVLFVFSCSQEKKLDTTTLSGKIENTTNDTINLIGSDFDKKIVLAEDGTFLTEVNLPYAGYYSAVLGRIPIILYLEQDKSLILKLDLDNSKETLTFEGDLALENQFLADKKEIGTPKDLRAFYKLEAPEFLDSLSEIHEKLNTALSESNLTNTGFIESQKEEFLYQQASYLNSYKGNYTYLTEAKEELILPDNFFISIDKLNLSDTLKYRTSPGYQKMLQGHLNKLVNDLPEEENSNINMQYIELVNKTIPASYAKNQLLKSAMGYKLKPDKYLEDVYTLFMSYQTDEKLKEAMNETYATLSKLTPGNTSASFNYENYKGGTTRLEDLRGKYVYIDVWATWCVPCLNEAPYLKEVAKDYATKNIEFVAISIDEAKNYDKWRNMIAEKELAGIHLYAGGDAWKADFATAYRVNAIPRFILIDPEGNIADADTFRPSDKALRDLFDQILD